MAWDGRRIFVADIVKKRLGPDQVVDLVKRTAVADGPACDQVIEEELGAAGKIMVAQFKKLLQDTPGAGRVFPSPVSGGKEARAFMFASRVNEGNGSLVVGGWNQEFSDECDSFPDGDHDDMVDAAAHAYNRLDPRNEAPLQAWIPGLD